jgi:hypothetical protein
MLQAQRLVSQAAASKENVEHARRSAEAILRALFEQCEWDVKVVWEETPVSQVPNDATAVTAGTCQR